MNISKLEKAIRASGKSKIQISEECGVARMTLDNVLKGRDVKMSFVESLAECLSVNVGYFYDDATHVNAHIMSDGDNNTISDNNSDSVLSMELALQNKNLLKEVAELRKQNTRLIDLLINSK